MKAVAHEGYGPSDALHLKEVEKPAPREDPVLVSIHAVAVNYGD